MDKIKVAAPSPDFPRRYDIAVSPENRFVNLARVLGIAAVFMAGLIAVLAGALYLYKSYKNSDAMIIVIPEDNRNWVMQGENIDPQQMTRRNIQEAIARDFARRWFRVTSSEAANDAIWRTCVLDKCGNVQENIQGELCCQTTADIFARFMNGEVPAHRRLVRAGKTQEIAVDDAGWPKMSAVPLGNVDFEGAGTMWRLDFDVAVKGGAANDIKSVVAFARVGTNARAYPKSMGQHITEFYWFFR